MNLLNNAIAVAILIVLTIKLFFISSTLSGKQRLVFYDNKNNAKKMHFREGKPHKTQVPTPLVQNIHQTFEQ